MFHIWGGVFFPFSVSLPWSVLFAPLSGPTCGQIGHPVERVFSTDDPDHKTGAPEFSSTIAVTLTSPLSAVARYARG